MLTVANIKEAKVVMLGSSTVGKSTIIKWLVSQKYQNNTTPTIGTSLITKTFDIDGLCIKLQIWDTGGSERYRSIAPMYFRDADAAIIVYDVTQKSSFEDVGSWLKELREYGPSSIIIGLAGNKTDLQDRSISTVEGKQYAGLNHLDVFTETSAFNGQNIYELFFDIASLIGKTDFNFRRPSMDITIQPKEEKCC